MSPLPLFQVSYPKIRAHCNTQKKKWCNVINLMAHHIFTFTFTLIVSNKKRLHVCSVYLQEPLESCNKIIKDFQLNHSSQAFLSNRNLDTYNRQFIRSCPDLHRYLDRNSRNRRDANDDLESSQFSQEAWADVMKLDRNYSDPMPDPEPEE